MWQKETEQSIFTFPLGNFEHTVHHNSLSVNPIKFASGNAGNRGNSMLGGNCIIGLHLHSSPTLAQPPSSALQKPHQISFCRLSSSSSPKAGEHAHFPRSPIIFHFKRHIKDYSLALNHLGKGGENEIRQCRKRIPLEGFKRYKKNCWYRPTVRQLQCRRCGTFTILSLFCNYYTTSQLSHSVNTSEKYIKVRNSAGRQYTVQWFQLFPKILPCFVASD